MGEHWRASELALLRQSCLSGFTVYGTAARLGRSADLVRKKAEEMGLKFIRQIVLPTMWVKWSANPELVEQLKQLKAEGLSTALIAQRMGIGRSAVIGKLHRLGLSGQPSQRRVHPINAARKERRERQEAKRAQTRLDVNELPTTPMPKPEPNDIPRKPNFELEPGDCRWVCIDDPAKVSAYDPVYCAAPRVPGLSYCEHHAHRAYRPSDARKPDSLSWLPQDLSGAGRFQRRKAFVE